MGRVGYLILGVVLGYALTIALGHLMGTCG